MKKTIFVIIIILSLGFSVGCPYDSKYPLSNPEDARVDKKLLGDWELVDVGKEEPLKLTFIQFNNNELLVILRGSRENIPVIMRVFTTNIKDQAYLNIQEFKKPLQEISWMIVCYSFAGDTLEIKIVEEILFKEQKINSSKELADFIKKNINNKRLYSKKSIFKKAKQLEEVIQIAKLEKQLHATFEKHTKECKEKIKKRNYKKIIEICDKALDEFRDYIGKQKDSIDLHKKTKEYILQFGRWKKAAAEGEKQKRALKYFQSLNLKVDKIIFDEDREKCVVVINDQRFKEGDNVKGAIIRKIKKDEVWLIVGHEERKYQYTLREEKKQNEKP